MKTKKGNKKEEMTMNKLAGMMQDGFKMVGKEFNGLRKEVEGEISELAEMTQREFGAVRSEMNEGFNRVDEKFERVDEKFDEILGREDRIFKSLENLETDNTMSAGASRRHEDRLENHEERIVIAEEKLGIKEMA